MLLFFVVSTVLQLTIATGFFDRCPMERKQRVDSDQVFDVLQTFYYDLAFVQASTESPEDHDFDRIIGEMVNLVSSDFECQPFEDGLELLRRGEIIKASHTLEHVSSMARINWIPAPLDLRSYMHYFTAEAFRLVGSIFDALGAIKQAITDRTESEGIPLNELERLDGLVVLQRVSNFNQDVDKLYGLDSGPNFEQLQIAHSDLKDKIDPFSEMRHALINRMFRSNRSITLALRGREIGAFKPSPTPMKINETSDHWPITSVPDIFNRRSVAKNSAEDILCEFARKLAILVHDAREDGGIDYSSLIGQLKQIDAGYAEQFDRKVVQNLMTKNTIDAMNSLMSDDQMPDQLIEPLKTYAQYFEAEIVRSRVGCKDTDYVEILLHDIKTIRHSNRGVSLDKLLELEGRLVVKLMKCFRDRLVSVYELKGDESEEELESKRARFGSCENYYPFHLSG